jgi:menaquinone-dependent protoporphyrinogen oxidase
VRALDDYSAVALGGALYMGRLHQDAAGFLKRHRHALKEIPLAVFAMGPKTMAEADVAASRKQLDHALAAVPELTPVAVAIFGGVVDPSKLRFPFKRMPASDARDWDAIDAWSRDVSVLFAGELETVPA